MVFFRFKNSLGALSSERADNDRTHLKLKSEPASLKAHFFALVRFFSSQLSKASHPAFVFAVVTNPAKWETTYASNEII